MSNTIEMLTDRLSMERARADRLDAECAELRAEVEALRQLLRAIRKTVPMHSTHQVVADRIDAVLAASSGGSK